MSVILKTESALSPADVSGVPDCEAVEVAVKFVIITVSKSTLIRLTNESAIVMFVIFNNPDVLPG